MFHIGQKVVCVDDRPGRIVQTHTLKRGAIYTIYGFDTEDPRSTGLIVEECRLGIVPPWREELGWGITRFRPVIKRQTDIGIFTEMLKNVRTKIPT